MTDQGEILLSEYMNVLFRLTKAEYYFCVEAKDKKITTSDKDYETLCKLIKEAGELYNKLIKMKINPPIWGDKVVMYDKDIKK